MEKRSEQLEVLENVHEMITEALTLAANEPSVGVYYVQEHVHKAVPFVLRMKDRITEATGDVDLAMADVKDSLSCIKSMKECGPPVIERMIKMLESASNQIPTNRQSRGSFAQLLPRPSRPTGPSRASSFLGDWRSDNSSNKGWESFRKERSTAEKGKKKGPPLPASSSKKAERSQKRVTGSNPQVVTDNSAGCDSADPPMRNEMAVPLQEASASDPPHYVISLLGSAISKSREGVKLITKDVENPFTGDGRVAELKNWISTQSLRGLGRKSESVPETSEVDPTESEVSSEDLIRLSSNFEHFQAERAAKLEAWLSEPDDKTSK